MKSFYEPIDLARLVLQLGATFVARSFSGDKQQLEALIKAAISHRSLAFIDVVSPRLIFNTNARSKKSYEFVREHCEVTGTIDFVPMIEEITTEYAAGTTEELPYMTVLLFA
ncbi:MAG: 2-oxoglutarate ferredoxin oxidoreductase subunit beta [Kiritimatiellia bacterium]|jgi:2-oxoglutarate ferredoxin oxidoreductase subunit beta